MSFHGLIQLPKEFSPLFRCHQKSKSLLKHLQAKQSHLMYVLILINHQIIYNGNILG
jgi:hypothetical protein